MLRFVRRNWDKLLVLLVLILGFTWIGLNLRVDSVEDRVARSQGYIVEQENSYSVNTPIENLQCKREVQETNAEDSFETELVRINSVPDPTPGKQTVFIEDIVGDKDDIRGYLREYSDGSEDSGGGNNTDPVPPGKPQPVNEEDQVELDEWIMVYISIDCKTILDNWDDLDPDKIEFVPKDGVILPETEVRIHKGSNVFKVLQTVCEAKGIHMASRYTPIYGSVYVEGINNLYEFDCGPLSGWCYSVEDWFPNYGCSRYVLIDGEHIKWRYTCQDCGGDVGCDIPGK